MRVRQMSNKYEFAHKRSEDRKNYSWTVVDFIENKNASYQTKTKEIYRIDYKTLTLIHPHKFVKFNQWEHSLKIQKTHHVIEERLKLYVNKPINDTVEITPEEYEFLNATPLETFVHNWDAKLVELGFNIFGEICKAAYTMYLPSGRVLFFCVGMDHGLKTLYVTPQFKHRDSYRGCHYLSAEEAIKL